ncbi:GTPase [Fundicoccus sp. Sow4_F4]|uniref:YcjF family protein n=1 Tax=Fundicoccus sp. Sow4_F4 TaxID=3438783 RepID=UPI003F913C64
MSLWSKMKKRNMNPQLAQDLLAKSHAELSKMQPINIMIAGKTGSGKSTLINALFREKIAETGVGMPITQEVQKLTKEGIPLTLFDTQGLELNVDVQHDVLTSLSALIKQEKAKGERDQLHLAYYCLNANMSRIESYEIELISAIAQQLPVILILTQTIGEETERFEQYLQSMALPVEAIVPVLAKDYRIQKSYSIQSFGLQELIDITLEVIPSEVHKAFINAQRIDIQLKEDSAKSWAKTYISSAFGVGFTPIPIADASLLVPMQITMLGHITAIFGLSLDKSQILSMIAGIGGTGGATLFGKFLVSSAFKVIPGIGTITGGVISGATASVLTVTLAYSYIEVLKRIAMAEATGQDLKLVEIQKLMNQSLKDQLAIVSDILPDSIKNRFVPEWLDYFIK